MDHVVFVSSLDRFGLQGIEVQAILDEHGQRTDGRIIPVVARDALGALPRPLVSYQRLQFAATPLEVADELARELRLGHEGATQE